MTDSIKSEAVYRHSVETKRRVTDILSREEIKELTQRSDWMGAWAIAMTFGGVAMIFVLMAWLSHLTWWVAAPALLLGMLFLAGRQLSMSILVHDAAHGTLFKTKWLNTTLTDWLCARPLWNDLAKYRAYHFIHHTRTGTTDDPDLILRDGYPTTPWSMTRKFARDLAGVNGLKYLLGRILMDMGVMQWTVTGEVRWLPREGKRWYHLVGSLIKEAWPMVLSNIALWAVLSTFGYGWLYLCWIAAHLTFFMALMRIRSMAEHAACARNLNMFENTRTVRANWLARSLVAPIGVNYHMEHHILASCPWHKLSKAHRILRDRNVVPKPPSYWGVMQIMTQASSGSVAASVYSEV